MVPAQYRPRGRTVKALADDVEDAIRTGRLGPDTALPPIRTLAQDLGIAAGTVAGAYAALRDRGLTESRGRNGTHVRARPAVAVRWSPTIVGADVTDLAEGQPGRALLPRLELDPALGVAAAPSQGVLPELAAAARERLSADGVPVGEIALANGGLDGIGRVLGAQLRAGDAVAVEDPGWPNALDLVATLGLRPVPLPLDGQGARPDGLRSALQAGVRAVIITDRAHNPTGAFLSPGRATDLRRVLADHPGTLVIEDDHAAELAEVPLATLAGSTERWAFVRSASKPYGPDLRIAVITGDEETVGRVTGRMRIGSGWVSTVLQRLLLGCWTSEGVADQVRSAARTYAERRRLLIDTLAEQQVPASGDAGLNVWVPVPDETAAVSGLLHAGWAVSPGARFRQRSSAGIRITVSNLEPRAIPDLVNALVAVLRPARTSGYPA